MKLSSARSLKAELTEKLCGRAHERVVRYETAHGEAYEVRVPSPAVALGITRTAKGCNDFKLAVRVKRGREAAAAPILRALARRADEDEVDVRRDVHYALLTAVQTGASCGHFRGVSGTLGAFVVDAGKTYALGNAHVFANSGRAKHGDPVLLPGPTDAVGTPHTVMGRLERFAPLSPVTRDGVDAAIALLDPKMTFTPRLYAGIGTIKAAPITDRKSVHRVAKLGKRTGVTRGTVRTFELDGVEVDYGLPGDPHVVTYDDQLELMGDDGEPFSDHGDSGSLVIDTDTMSAYGLLFAGGTDSTGATHSIANFLPNVLAKLGVKLT